MQMKPFLKWAFPRAIMHLDGDAFFASVEVAKNPALKGKPVVTGEERGIATAISYEAKKYGIGRAVPIHEIRKKFPDVIIVHSDYESYALYSRRMKDVVRRFTENMEDSSIDECFADLTGLRRPLRMSYLEMATRIQKEIDDELGISVSIGVAPTKVLAKLASKWAKPHGLTLIPGNMIHHFLEKTPIGRVWGIGPQTSAYLVSRGIHSALDFALKDEAWVRQMLTKPHQEIWKELRGESVYALSLGKGTPQQSISKTETFTPPSIDPTQIFSELSRNIERACQKARALQLSSRRIHFFLKTQEFIYHTGEYSLESATNDPLSILGLLRTAFPRLYKKGTLYRATGVTLDGLVEDHLFQEDLFGLRKVAEGHNAIFKCVDSLEEEIGKGTVFLASSMASVLRHQKEEEQRKPMRESSLPQRFSGIPVIGEVR